MEPIIRAVEVWKRYGDADGEAAYGLRGASLDVNAGEIVALCGKSGSGKTTLLNLIAGLDRPSSGQIFVEGRDLLELGEKGQTQLRRRRIGFVFQFFNLLPTLTALENVRLALELCGETDDRKARDALDAVGLEGKERRYPNELSGGEQQRVAIARALVKEPAIILADEPTGNLDTRTGDMVLDLLVRQVRESRTALVMATHSSRTAAVSDRVLHMADGELTAEEPLREGRA